MKIHFYKYHGAGNDFIMIDDRNQTHQLTSEQISFLCHRRFGVGADGLILLQNAEQYDFKMRYFNADGKESTMCGNGGRCIVAFAQQLGIVSKQCQFEAIDGLHKATMLTDGVKLEMQNVNAIVVNDNQLFLDTGSPHHISFVDDVSLVDVNVEGAKIRNSALYGKAGSNVNFVETDGNSIALRTYERGVEAETLACGTGVTAAALASHHQAKTKLTSIEVKAQGGNLKVDFKWDESQKKYYDIWLSGPAKFVFEAYIQC